MDNASLLHPKCLSFLRLKLAPLDLDAEKHIYSLRVFGRMGG